ncbi:hypothetical protein [Streptomyces xanthophaeus]|uniref:hypothetical protein n=1 Tax=Streptomyces xanthophaeus TaxID=67385 RepID=UPI0026486BE4|nr:hypothetical protein [Streptomyces xanthophaeus]WKD37432.1 hypothetical protein KO717_24485 [Streptomyces xanthophaeus]
MGISGFEPSFLVGIDAVRHAHGARLAALDGTRVEVCHTKFDELSIGWGTISTTAVITGWDEAGPTPEWSHRDARLEPFLGHELRDLALIEWRPAGRDLATGTLAVEFVFDAGRLRIANGLDENSIETGPALETHLRHGPGH